MLHHLSQRQKIIVMLAVMSGLFLAALDQTIVGTALPKILTEFHSLDKLSWVITAYLLTSTISVPIAGKLSDLFGRRRLLMIGIVVFVLSSLLCGAAQNIEELIAFRALQGIGGGILFANAFAIIGDLFDARERGKWQGIFGATFGLASLVGPLLGGFLTDGNNLFGLMTNWRWTFLINVPVGILSFSLIARFMPTIIAKAKPIIDYLGAILLSIGLGSLVLATSLGGTKDWAWDSPQIVGLFTAAVIGTVAFIFAERRAQEPLLPLRFFHSSIFNLISIIFLLFGMAFFGAIIYIPTFAQQVLGFSATNSGVLLLPMVLGLTVSSIVTGQIVNRTGKYKIFIVLGLALATLGVFTLTGLTIHSGYFDLAWRMAIAGLGMGMAMPVFNLAVQNAMPQKDLGVASSSVQLFRSIGGTVGLAVTGTILTSLLTTKLTNIDDEPFVKMAAASGHGDQFKDITVNSIQGILSPQAQSTIVTGHTPQPVVDAFHHLVGTLQTALASSITHIFLISACVMAVAFFISFGVKELPLRHHDEVPPTE